MSKASKNQEQERVRTQPESEDKSGISRQEWRHERSAAERRRHFAPKATHEWEKAKQRGQTQEERQRPEMCGHKVTAVGEAM